MLSPDSPEPTVAGFLPATGLGASLLPIAVVGGLLAVIGLMLAPATTGWLGWRERA